MYIKIFRRKESELLYGQFCNGHKTRDVRCLDTPDADVAQARACLLAREQGHDEGEVSLVWDLPGNRTLHGNGFTENEDTISIRKDDTHHAKVRCTREQSGSLHPNGDA